MQAAGGKAEEQEPDQNPYCHPGETNFYLILKGQCHEIDIFFKVKLVLSFLRVGTQGYCQAFCYAI
jgi:hypothetical protein